LLAHAYVVPIVVWDPAEIEPPALDAPRAAARRGVRRASHAVAASQAAQPVARRRRAPANGARTDCSAAHAIRPFYVVGAFDAEAMSQYFLEAGA
jgi:hypothetical protein